jgi:hypothetical protein
VQKKLQKHNMSHPYYSAETRDCRNDEINESNFNAQTNADISRDINYYQVLGVSRHSETLEEFVVYQALYGDFGIWVRPIHMFNEKIHHNSIEVPRFKFISHGMSQAPGIGANA